MKRIGVIIQARTSSSRLPDKILKQLPFSAEVTVLEQVINRVSVSKKIDDVIVATTKEKQDDKIADLLKQKDVKVFRGEKDDVLSRYYFAAYENCLDVIVRITSDCPCVDPDIIDLVIDTHIGKNADYTSNRIKHTYPIGLDVEIFNFDSLKYCQENAILAYEREHVTPFFYYKKNTNFKIVGVEAPEEFSVPGIRITLDAEEDYILLCVVFDQLYYKNKMFKTRDIVALFKHKPWLYLINAKVPQKKIESSLEDEVDDAINLLDLHELQNVSRVIKEYRDKYLKK